MVGGKKTDKPYPFDKRVCEALALYAVLYREASNRKSARPKLNIASFMKFAKISRSILYEKYPSLLRQIEASFTTLIEEDAALEKAARKPSIAYLKKELADVRRKAKHDLAAAHSTTMSDLIQRYGPAFRDATQMMIERQQHIRTIESLRKQLENQAEIINQLMAQINN